MVCRGGRCLTSYKFGLYEFGETACVLLGWRRHQTTVTKVTIMLFTDHNDSEYSDRLQIGKYVVRIQDTGRTLNWFPIYESHDHDLIVSMHGKKNIYYIGESGAKYKIHNGNIKKVNGKKGCEYKTLRW